MKVTLDRSKYASVSPVLRDRLFRFVDRAEFKELQVGDRLRQYLDLAAAETGPAIPQPGTASSGEIVPAATHRPALPVLFFAGGIKLPIYSFAVIEALMQCSRVIAPTQPPCSTLDECFAGVDAILRREGVNRFYAAGSSWGGQIAQVAAMKYPDRVEKLILANTGLSGGKAVSLMLRLHLASVRRSNPAKILATFRKRALGLLADEGESAAFWEALFDDLYAKHMTYGDYVSLIETQLDYVDNYADKVAGQGWTKPVVILMSKNEVAGSAGWRAALLRAYPGARVHRFESGGHHPALLHQDEYRRVVAEFLAGG